VFKKFLAITSTLLLALGLSFVAVAAPASAHHTDVSAKATCTSDGGWDITWTVVNSENFEGKVTASNNAAIPVDTILPANPNYNNSNSLKNTFTQHVTSNTAVNATITVKWFRTGNTVEQTSNVTFSNFPAGCFDWNWEYPDPTCDALTVTYPTGLPAGQSNDVNIRIKYGVNFSSEVTLNFHNNTGTWSGTQTFTYATHPNWPANIGQYKVVWTQVGGTNYHWQGEVTCGELPKDASAVVSTTTPTCETGSSLVLGAIVNATWGIPVITGSNYSVTATASAGHLFPNGQNSLTLTGTLAGPNTGGVCDDVSVQLTITYVAECAVDADNTWRIFNPSEETVTVTYGAGQTYQATPGYSTLTTPRTSDPLVITWGADASGIKPGTATGTPGADLTGEDEECYTSPDVTKVVGDCAYYSDGTAGNRTVKITYDNTDSNVPVTFSLQGFQGVYDRTVPAGETVVVDAPNVVPAGGTYTVIAAGKTFSLEITPCPTYEKPEPKVEQRPVASFDCDDTVVTIVTTTYTAEPIFDTETLTWGYGEWVEGESVTTTRAPLPSEVSEEGCVVTVTDPTASTCEVTDDTELTSWIRIQLNANVEYRIDDVVVTDEFTSVTPGSHTVKATALNGYSLAGANPAPDDWTGDTHTWTFTAVDSAVDCTPEAPSLAGSTAVGECKADAPWIEWSVSMSDPDNQVPTKHATLVLSDGTNSQTIDLGDLVLNETTGKWELNGANLWPGASIDSEGNATGWPGWEQLSDGTWQETTGNFAWVRNITSATLHVNPELVIDLQYPDAEPLCDGPHEPPTLADVLPAYDSTPLTCTTKGSYTIGAEFGDVTWTVNGTVVEAGTYEVPSATTITLVATPTNEDDTLNEAWKDEPVVLSFALPAGECASAVPPSPAQLAFTGAAASAGVVWAGLLVILTGLGLYFLRRKPTAD